MGGGGRFQNPLPSQGGGLFSLSRVVRPPSPPSVQNQRPLNTLPPRNQPQNRPDQVGSVRVQCHGTHITQEPLASTISPRLACAEVWQVVGQLCMRFVAACVGCDGLGSEEEGTPQKAPLPLPLPLPNPFPSQSPLPKAGGNQKAGGWGSRPMKPDLLPQKIHASSYTKMHLDQMFLSKPGAPL